MHFTLVYYTYFESKLKFRYSETYSLIQKKRISGSTLSMQTAKIRCFVETTDRKGLSFLDFLDQCSFQVVTAKFYMSDDLVRSLLKAKSVQILVMKCVSEMQFMQ